jgi:hypothetical protein
MFRPRTLCQIKPAPKEDQVINTHKTSLPLDYFNKTPTFKNIPKDFPTKSKKPLQLTNRAFLVQKIDRKTIEELPSKEQMIDFNKLLQQFKSEEEVQDLEVADLLDIDSKILDDLMKKCRDFTDAAAYLSEEKERTGQLEEAKSDQQFMQYLMNQYIEMQNNSINLAIAVNNIEKIKGLQYNSDGVKVYFKN